MKIKKTCDVCGKEFEYPFYAYLWDKAICFDCAWVVGPEKDFTNVVILPGGGHDGQ